MSNDANIYVLQEEAEVRLGHPFRGAIPEVGSGTIRVIQTKDIVRAAPVDYSDLLTTELTTRREPDWVRDQDLLFASRGTNNHAALVTRPPPRTTCSPHLYIIRIKTPERLLPAFLTWQFNQPPIQRYLRQSAEGSAQLSIRRAVLEQTPIRIPSLAKQHAIIELDRTASAERSKLQALIRNREAELAFVAEQLLS